MRAPSPQPRKAAWLRRPLEPAAKQPASGPPGRPPTPLRARQRLRQAPSFSVGFSTNYLRRLILNRSRAFLHSTLSLLFALLLISVPAPSLADEVTTSPLPPASALPLAADLPFCLENAPQLPASTEKGPPASPAAFPIPQPTCGACSSWDCRGVALSRPCQNGLPQEGEYYGCFDVGVCSADGSWHCECSLPR